ncbi:hypothetical protein GHT09_002320 [Marmota monax]|uniref:Uncharacterized protein n=1 Tax=Marmota monax TaxID=9995 RepID=A0A834QY25_MARMO|nr:hypothetical protein GHT09_002320 [Marmota monax]
MQVSVGRPGKEQTNWKRQKDEKERHCWKVSWKEEERPESGHWQDPWRQQPSPTHGTSSGEEPTVDRPEDGFPRSMGSCLA